MRRGVELSNVEDITFVFQDSRFVVVDIEVVRSREESHDRRETCRPCLSVHAVSSHAVNRTTLATVISRRTQHPVLRGLG